MSVQKKGLGSKGRGLEALISRTENINEKGVAEIDINKISGKVENGGNYEYTNIIRKSRYSY